MDTMGKLNARDRDSVIHKRLESSHRRAASLDHPMILLDDVVQVLAVSDLDVCPAPMLPAQQPQRSMARYVSIERDLARHAGRLGGKSFAEERLSRCDAAIGAKQKIDCLAVLVDGAVQVMPLALDRDVGLVDSPGGPNRDCRAGDLDAALGHHLHEVAIGKPIRDVPPYAELDNVGIEGALVVHRVTSDRLLHPPPLKRARQSNQCPPLHQNHPSFQMKITDPNLEVRPIDGPNPQTGVILPSRRGVRRLSCLRTMGMRMIIPDSNIAHEGGAGTGLAMASPVAA